MFLFYRLPAFSLWYNPLKPQGTFLHYFIVQYYPYRKLKAVTQLTGRSII